MTDLIRENLVIEHANAFGDGGLVAEELASDVTHRAKKHTSNHFRRAGERQRPLGRREDQTFDEQTKKQLWRTRMHLQTEDRDDLGEQARVVGLLQMDVKKNAVIDRQRQPAINLGEPDGE